MSTCAVHFIMTGKTRKPPKRKQETVEAIRKRLQEMPGSVSAQALARLQRDPRPGAQRLYATLKRRFERERDERLRVAAMLHFERLLWRSGITQVAGVDEAGVGALAGPVVAAAVLFPPDTEILGIDDSKRLRPDRRATLAETIRVNAFGIGVGRADVTEIDALNIHQAALLAMRRAVEALPVTPEHLLVDARTIPGLDVPQNPYTRGDGLNFSIAAASIIAKTTRDEIMDELDATYPGYGFRAHKGYDTPSHRAALKKLGPCPAHRRSYAVIQEICGENSPPFYALRRTLAAARDRDALEDFEARFARRAPELKDSEARKLRTLAARRWRTYG